ncbi:C2H2-like zinc finger protein [Euphorbia peplus]|nr:C2H2-like zinc finger protein [Euphorbia peplus]
MEKTRICKICNRRFANGKAMGGHMRSHLAIAKLPHLPPKPKPQPLPPPQPQPQQQLHHSLSSSSSSLHLRPPSPNPFQVYRSVNHDLAGSDSESPRSSTTTRRRSKRRRKSVEKVAESAVKVVEYSSVEQVSSVSDEISNEEDVAMCLLMLSKDGNRLENKEKQELVRDEFIEGSTDDHDYDEEIEEDEDESFGEIPVRSKSNRKYNCRTCKKSFRSYQALGGHKARHKKIQKEDEYDGIGNRTTSCGGVFVDPKIYKCPFCEKVFDSGQALGGHKKVHFSYLGNNMNKSIVPKSKSGENLLDLNLPAPEEDEEDDELELRQVYEHRNNW